MAEWATPAGVHSQCGYAGSYPPTWFVDGETATCWFHPVDHAHWIVLDLGQSKTVEKIQIYVKDVTPAKLNSFDVYVSDDPGDWGAAVAENVSATTGGQWNELDVTDKSGRYIKLDEIDTAAPSDWIEGYEFQAYVSAVPVIGDFTTDAIIKKIQTTSLTADAYLARAIFADAVIFKTQQASIIADAILRKMSAASLTGDSVLQKTASGTLDADGVLRKAVSDSIGADGVLFKTISDAIPGEAYLTHGVFADGVIWKTQQASFSAHAVIFPVQHIFMKAGPIYVPVYPLT